MKSLRKAFSDFCESESYWASSAPAGLVLDAGGEARLLDMIYSACMATNGSDGKHFPRMYDEALLAAICNHIGHHMCSKWRDA